MKTLIYFTNSLFIAVVIYFSFYKSLDNGFAFDDHLAIGNNKDVVNINSNKIWTNDIWGKDIQADDSHRSYRPFLIKTFQLITVYTNGSPSPYHMRIVSIAFHFIMSCLLMLLCEMLCGNPFIGVGASLLFASHPIHVEAVVAVVNMAEAISALLIVSSYLLVLANVSSESVSFSKLVIHNIIWFALVVISILFKETGLVACLLVFSYTLLLLLKWILMIIFQSETRQSLIVRSPLRILFWNLTSIFTIFLYFSFRNLLVSPYFFETNGGLSVIDFISKLVFPSQNIFTTSSYISNDSLLIRKTENPFSVLKGNEKVFSMMYLHFRYFYLLIYPTEQSPEYAFDCIPKVQSINDFRSIYSIATYSSILILIIIGIIQIISHLPSKNNDDDISDDMNTYYDKTIVVLHFLIWLLVPFIPLSGLVFKLGTLLAERLLYMTSIGYCLLFSYILYHMVMRLCQYRNMIGKTIYLICIVSVVYLYCKRTREYSSIWKDDNTLFLKSLKVCPRSAKLHMQVSKIWVQLEKLSKAKYHLDQAKAIDSDFCDTGYQEAVLKIGMTNDYDQGVELALNNLKCVYSNMQSLELIQKVWELQYSQALPQYKPSVLVKQADMAKKYDMVAMAAKRYLEATSLSFDNKQYKDALEFSKKAENSLKLIDKQSKNDSEMQIPLSLRCHINSIGGTVRLHLLINPVASIGSKYNKELQRGKGLLYKCLNTKCATASPDHFRVAVSYLGDYLMRNYNESKLDSIEEYAIYLTFTSVIMNTNYDSNILKTVTNNDSNNSKDNLNSQDSGTFSQTMRANACQLWSTIGMKYHELKDFIKTIKFFEEFLFCHLKSDDLLLYTSNNAILNRMKKIFSKKDDSTITLSRNGTQEMKIILNNINLNPPVCTSLFWYADAVINLKGFQENESLVKIVIYSMKIYLKCQQQISADGNNRKNRANDIIRQLEEFLKIKSTNNKRINNQRSEL